MPPGKPLCSEVLTPYLKTGPGRMEIFIFCQKARGLVIKHSNMKKKKIVGLWVSARKTNVF